MRRRGDASDEPISLFSLQDMITAVSGIMIVVALILVVEILRSNISREAGLGTPPIDSAKLEREIPQLQEAVAELRREINEAQTNTDSLSKIDLDRIPDEINHEKNQEERIRTELVELQSNLETLRRKAEQTERESRQMRDEIAVLEKKWEQVSAQVAASDLHDRVFFKHAQHSAKIPGSSL